MMKFQIVAQQAPSSSANQQKLLSDKFSSEAAIAVASRRMQPLVALKEK